MAKKLTVEEVRKAYYELSEIERERTGLKPCLTCHACDRDLSPSTDDDGDHIWPSTDLILFDLNMYQDRDTEYFERFGVDQVPICDNCISDNHVISESHCYGTHDDDDDKEEYWRLCCDLQGIPEEVHIYGSFQEYWPPGDFFLTSEDLSILEREAERRKKSNEVPFD